MKFEKKEVLMWVAGTLASAAVAFLIYRLEQNSAAQNAANEADEAASQESALANQQAQTASLPSINIPTIPTTPSSTPSTTDTTNQSASPAGDSGLYALISSLLADDNSTTTQATSPVASITALPIPTYTPPTNPVIPPVNNFTDTTTSGPAPIAYLIQAGGPTVTQTSNVIGNNGYRTNLATNASLASN